MLQLKSSLIVLFGILLHVVYGEVVSGSECCVVPPNPNVVSYSTVVNYLPGKGYYLSYTISVTLIDDDPQNGSLYASVGTSEPVQLCEHCTSITYTTPFTPDVLAGNFATPAVNFLLVRNDGSEVNLNFTCETGANQAGPQYCFAPVEATTLASTTATTYTSIPQSACSCGAVVYPTSAVVSDELVPIGVVVSSGQYFEVMQLQAQPITGFNVVAVDIEVDDQGSLTVFMGSASSFGGTFYLPFTPIAGDGPDSYGTENVTAIATFFQNSTGFEYTESYHLQSCDDPNPPDDPGYPAICFNTAITSTSTIESTTTSTIESTITSTEHSTTTNTRTSTIESTATSGTSTIESSLLSTATSNSMISTLVSSSNVTSMTLKTTSTALNTTLYTPTESSNVTPSTTGRVTQTILSTKLPATGSQSGQSVTAPIATGASSPLTALSATAGASHGQPSHVESLSNVEPPLPQSAPRIGMALRNQLSGLSLAGVYALALQLL